MKDFLVYVEDNITKAFDITDHKNDRELIELCKEAGVRILAYVADKKEDYAINYGMFLRKRMGI